MKRLGQWRFAAFKPTTNGTVATLLDQRIYDINAACEPPRDNQPSTIGQPTGNHRPTTNKKEKKQKREKKYSRHSDEWKLSELLLNLMRIEAVIRWCVKDPFWSKSILSAGALRKHFDYLELQMSGAKPKESLRERMARLEYKEMMSVPCRTRITHD